MHNMAVIQCPHCSLEVELDDGGPGLFDCPHCGEEFQLEFAKNAGGAAVADSVGGQSVFALEWITGLLSQWNE